MVNFDFVENLPDDLRDVVEKALRKIAIFKPFMRFIDVDDRGRAAYFIGRQVLAGIKRVGWDSTETRDFLNATLESVFKLPEGYDFKWSDDPPE